MLTITILGAADDEMERAKAESRVRNRQLVRDAKSFIREQLGMYPHMNIVEYVSIMH